MQSQSFLQKYELPLFLLLTYILSWWSVPFAEGRIIPHGPALAALIVLGFTVGKQGLGEWWRRVTDWRVPSVWFLAGPAVIFGYHAIAFILSMLLGAEVVSPPQLSTGTFLMLLFVGGLWEEPGWSGYLLPKMKERFAHLPNGFLIAALVTGFFRSLWHLPLYFYGHIPWFDVFIFSFAFQLIITWVLSRGRGSVLAVMLLHFVSNLMGSLTHPMFTGAERTTYNALFMSIAVLFALALILKSQFKQGASDESYSISRIRI